MDFYQRQINTLFCFYRKCLKAQQTLSSIWFNEGTNNITLLDENTGSLSENRFQIGANKVIQAGESLTLVYDEIVLRWFISRISI